MLPSFEENEKIGLLDLPIRSRTPKKHNPWLVVAAILATLLVFALLYGPLSGTEVLPITARDSNLTFPLKELAHFLYSDKVRTNVAVLLKNRTAVQYQQRDGPLRPFVNEYSKYPGFRCVVSESSKQWRLQLAFNLRSVKILQIANQYNLSACFVNKILSTSLHAIFCYLRDSDGFEREQLDLKKVYWNTKFCANQKEAILGSTAMLIDTLPAKHYTFQMIRDPIRRFVSAFVNKCVHELKQHNLYNNTRETCYGCNDNIECTVRRAYREMMQISRRERMYNIWATSKDYYTEHFMPLTWYCDVSTRSVEVEYIRYISHGEKKTKMTSDVIEIMKKAGVEQNKLEKIQAFLSDDGALTHATKGSSLPSYYLNKIYNSPKMLNTLNKMYYYDYFVFEYPVPQLGKIEPET